MSTIRVTHRAEGSPVVQNPPVEIKTVRMAGFTPEPTVDEAAAARAPTTVNSSSDSEVSSEGSAAPSTDAERRAQRKEEYREASLIRERAIQMQKKAEAQLKETENFKNFMQQAKDDPTAVAKALNMTPEEFQRKVFNKMYSIKEETAPVKEETFEEQTKRKLAEYEQERQADRSRREEEVRQNSVIRANEVKNKFIQDNILPAITEQHEFIHRNEKHSCAALVYDLMNQAYQEHCSQGGNDSNFTLKAQDVVDEMEAELEKRAIEQLSEARKIGKLKSHFRDEESEGLERKSFGSTPQRRQAAPTLSSSLGPSVPPSISSSLSSSTSRKIPLKDKNARREAAKRNLGG